MATTTISMKLPTNPDDEHTLTYMIEEEKNGDVLSRIEATPERPKRSIGNEPDEPELVRGVEFSLRLSDRLVLECAHPFTAFFRYGTPEKGDINSTDEEKQIRSRPLNNAGTLHRASVRAQKWGLYAPVVIVHAGEGSFLYDRGLSFEVNPAGA